MGYIFSVKSPAFDHYTVVLKENILDFKEIHEEVFTDKMSCNLLSSRSKKKKNPAHIYRRKSQTNVAKR